MYFHKAQEKPRLYGNFADRQYSIFRNLEDIYGCNHESEVLTMPLFWGLPCLDHSMFGNHGTNHGAIYKDGGLDFDGTDDYVTWGDNNIFDGLSLLTVSMWLDADAWDTHFFHKFYEVRLQHVNSKFEFMIYPSKTALSSVYTATDTPVKLDVTYGNGDIIFYIDGAIDTTTVVGTGVIPSNAYDLTIGSQSFTHADNFNGTIDEVRISNTTRTSEQIALFYERPWDLYRRVGRPVYFLPTGFILKPMEAKWDIHLQSIAESKYDLLAQKLAEVHYDITLQKLIESKCDILLQEIIEAKYDVQLQTTVESKYDILLQSIIEAKYDIHIQKLIESTSDIIIQKISEFAYDIHTQKIGQINYDIIAQKIIESKYDILTIEYVQKFLESKYDIHVQKDIEAIYDILFLASVREAFTVIGRTKDFTVIGRTKDFTVIGRTKDFTVM